MHCIVILVNNLQLKAPKGVILINSLQLLKDRGTTSSLFNFDFQISAICQLFEETG